jgi:hypothetical protein
MFTGCNIYSLYRRFVPAFLTIYKPTCKDLQEIMGCWWSAMDLSMVFSRKLVSNNPNSILISLFHHFLVKYFFYLYIKLQTSTGQFPSASDFRIIVSMFLLVIKFFFQMKSHANITISHSPARWWSQIWLKITIYPHLSIIFPSFSTIFPFFHHFSCIFFDFPRFPAERSQARLGRRRGPDRQDLGRRRAPRSLGLRGACHQPGGALISLNVEFIQLICGIWVKF